MTDIEKYVALAERCGAEVGRHEGEMVWMKFHRPSSVEAFATGIAMIAALRPSAAQIEAAIKQERAECAAICEALKDRTEEAKALAKFRAAEDKSVSNALHWSAVSLYNSGLNNAAVAIRARSPSTPQEDR